jgi:hypothetical protein
MPARNTSENWRVLRYDSMVPSNLTKGYSVDLKFTYWKYTYESTVRYKSEIEREEGKMGNRMNSRQSPKFSLRERTASLNRLETF